MRNAIIVISVIIAILIPACMLTAPDKLSPLPTSLPSLTQSPPRTGIPTGLSETQISPTLTPIPSATATQTPPTQKVPATPIPTETPLPAITYYMQSGTPLRVVNFVAQESGCKWMGIAGQVFNNKGDPIPGAVIEVGGNLNGQPVQQLALTGSSPIVGPGGYIIVISDHPVKSDGTLWLQLLDQAGDPKTGRMLLTTSDRCEENLLLINLVEADPLVNLIRLPIILKAP